MIRVIRPVCDLDDDDQQSSEGLEHERCVLRIPLDRQRRERAAQERIDEALLLGILGGLVSSTLLNLLVLPPLFARFARFETPGTT
ncbi:hypothetical protein [Polyangium jinanense]|uniref:Uncharacterized protein n=1 Tax=Polyangium jinanense TaxID=2829994 RepID=A0A9X3X9U3_9BACT|nr:hypothetical protein [Polyangium jinanense]MDC3960528.1 hypothetical protein [Polyangium jinanense]MDC3985390.1 hypothetical protein [Polyangium jinanense]